MSADRPVAKYRTVITTSKHERLHRHLCIAYNSLLNYNCIGVTRQSKLEVNVIAFFFLELSAASCSLRQLHENWANSIRRWRWWDVVESRPLVKIKLWNDKFPSPEWTFILYKSLPATPTWWVANPGSLLSPSPNQRARTAWSSLAWWKAKPCVEAAAAHRLSEMGTRSHTATFPSALHWSKESAESLFKKKFNTNDVAALLNNTGNIKDCFSCLIWFWRQDDKQQRQFGGSSLKVKEADIQSWIQFWRLTVVEVIYYLKTQDILLITATLI